MNKKNALAQFKIFTHRHPVVSVVAACLVVILVGLLSARIMLHRQRLPITETTVVYIPTGSSFQALTDTLEAHHCIVDKGVFCSLARARKLTNNVKGGRYKLEPGMSVVRMVNKFYRGNQDAVRVTINKHRTKQSLCQFLGRKLEFSADSLLCLLNDSATTAQYGFTPATIMGMFVQNTYEIYWDITPQDLLKRMNKEYEHFWNGVRQGECTDLGLNRQQVITLASIVEEETNKNDEKAIIASVYINRLHKGIPLQADPTVKYAVGDFSIRRILNIHLAAESPYNTYKHRGLPPGPICLPSIASIDAVLANMKTNYLYFCAKEDMSGYHNFAATPQQHMSNARRFHKALNEKNIYQ